VTVANCTQSPEDTQSKPFISVIMPAFNELDTIEDSIGSVLAQETLDMWKCCWWMETGSWRKKQADRSCRQNSFRRERPREE
jgi:hypothetical protein